MMRVGAHITCEGPLYTRGKVLLLNQLKCTHTHTHTKMVVATPLNRKVESILRVNVKSVFYFSDCAPYLAV